VRTRQRSQSLVEFAFTLPVFMLLVFVTIELGLVFISYYSETHMARETSRWLAVHSATTNDNELADQVSSTMLPGLVNGDWHSSLPTNGNSTTPSEYYIGRMTVDFTACMPNGAVNNGAGTGICTNTNRIGGSTLYVQMSYDVSNLLFLPTTFHFGSLTVSLPTALPVYRVSTMVE
jgi:Flp pilus assembly protein TadG